MVHKLVSLCVTLNEYPHVRYNQNSVLGARLATMVQEALNVRAFVRQIGIGSVYVCIIRTATNQEYRSDRCISQEFVARQEDWWYFGQQGHTERERGTLLLLDRAEDPLTPLIHEHTYQARRASEGGSGMGWAVLAR